eukprot:g17.t1
MSIMQRHTLIILVLLYGSLPPASGFLAPTSGSPRSYRNLRWIRHRAKARKHVENGDLERARQSFEDLLHTKGGSLTTTTASSIHIELGGVIMELGDSAGARYNFLEAQSYQPQSYLPHVQLAALESKLGRIDAAITSYKHALFFNSTDEESLRNIGALHLIRGDLDEAFYYLGFAFIGKSGLALLIDQSHSSDSKDDAGEEPALSAAHSFDEMDDLAHWLASQIIDGLTQPLRRSLHKRHASSTLAKNKSRGLVMTGDLHTHDLAKSGEASWSDFHVTLFVPRNEKGDTEMMSDEYVSFLRGSVDEIVYLQFMEEIHLGQLPALKTEIRKKFSMPRLQLGDKALHRQTQAYFRLPRVDVLILVGPILDPTVYYLSHSRLAPVQVAFWGGAGTTGLGEASVSTVDYFVAPAMMLSSEAHRAYSEQLVRLPGAGAVLPTEIENLTDDAQPNVLHGARKYKFGAFFLYSKYRYAAVVFDDISQLHPGMDFMLRSILRRVESAQILLVQRPTPRICRRKFKLDNTPNTNSRGNDMSIYTDSNLGLDQVVKRIRGDGSFESADNVSGTNRLVNRVESALVPTLESLLIGTPVVTLKPNETVRGWDNVQPTSTSAALIEAIDATGCEESARFNFTSTFVAQIPKDYVSLAAALLMPMNYSLHHKMKVQLRKSTRAWVTRQNKEVKLAWVRLLERLGRPYAEWRTAVMINMAKEANMMVYDEEENT